VSARPPALARWSWLLVLAALMALSFWFARGHDLEADIRRDVAASGGKLVDLPKSVPFVWNRVCVAAPYTRSKAVGDMLGFEWDSDAHSDVRSDDGVVLLVFASGAMVVGAVDYSRELMPWAGKCYPREAARFQIL
jgi:hypothetical protein